MRIRKGSCENSCIKENNCLRDSNMIACMDKCTKKCTQQDFLYRDNCKFYCMTNTDCYSDPQQNFVWPNAKKTVKIKIQGEK